ncbi:MAG: hypothetical protein Q8L29_01175 [archaeon]|nr:hypothetical protein [archaeon]
MKFARGLQSLVLGAGLALGGLTGNAFGEEAPRMVTPEELEAIDVKKNKEYVEHGERIVIRDKKENKTKIERIVNSFYVIESDSKNSEKEPAKTHISNKKIKESLDLEKLCYLGDRYNEDEKKFNPPGNLKNGYIEHMAILKVIRYNLSSKEKIILGVRLDRNYENKKFETKIIDFENGRVLDVKPAVRNDGKEIRHTYEPLEEGAYVIGWFADGAPCEFYKICVGQREVIKNKEREHKRSVGEKILGLNSKEFNEAINSLAEAIPSLPAIMMRDEKRRKLYTIPILANHPKRNCFNDIIWGDVIYTGYYAESVENDSNKLKAEERAKLEKLCYLGRSYNKDKNSDICNLEPTVRINNISPGGKITLGVKLDKKYKDKRFETRVISVEQERVLNVGPTVENDGKEIRHTYEPLEEGAYVIGWFADGVPCEFYNVIVGKSRFYEDMEKCMKKENEK